MKRLYLNENNENIIRTNNAFKNGGILTAVDKDAVDEVLNRDDLVLKMNKELLDISKSTIPENPGRGKKIELKPYTESKKYYNHRRQHKTKKMNEGWEDLDSYRDTLYDIMEEASESEIKELAQDLIYWCSEDEIKRFMELRDYDLLYEDEDEDDEDAE